MIVSVTKLPLKPGKMDEAQALLKEVAPGVVKDADGVQRVYYTAHGDSIRAFGIWDSAKHYNTFTDGGEMAKALAPFKELLAGPPEKWVHECFFNVEK